jgi:hypothetical protein
LWYKKILCRSFSPYFLCGWVGKICHKKNADFDQTKGFLMTEFRHISKRKVEWVLKMVFERGGGGGWGFKTQHIRSTYTKYVPIQCLCKDCLSSSSSGEQQSCVLFVEVLLVCIDRADAFLRCVVGVIAWVHWSSKHPILCVLLVLLFVCALITQTPIFWCVVGVIICVLWSSTHQSWVCCWCYCLCVHWSSKHQSWVCCWCCCLCVHW